MSDVNGLEANDAGLEPPVESPDWRDVSPADSDVRLDPRGEIRAFIATQEGRIGDVFRLSELGLGAEQIADELNVATPSFVYTYRYQIDAAVDGKRTSGAVLRRQALSAMNSLIKKARGELSAEALKLLISNRLTVEAADLETDAQTAAEADRMEEDSATDTLEGLRGVPGIYAFSYGWYLESQVDPERGNTLIKVGQAGDTASRIRQHTAGARTHMPEPLALIRVYSTGARPPLEIEKIFHDLLDSAGHANPRRAGISRREVGKEWYLTNEDFLDSVAKALQLRTLYIGRSEFGGD